MKWRSGWRLVVVQFLQHVGVMLLGVVVATGEAAWNAALEAAQNYVTSGSFYADGHIDFAGLKGRIITGAIMGIIGLYIKRKRGWVERQPTVSIGTTAGGDVKVDASPATPAQVVVEAPATVSAAPPQATVPADPVVDEKK